MKLIIALVFLCVSYNTLAQNKSPEVNSPESSQFIDSLSQYLATFNNQPETVDITADFWDTSKIKIDYDTEVAYPIHIQFKDSNYVSPISKKKVVTSRYGWRWGRAHKGIDIDLVTGDSLFAMFDGVVRFADYSSGHGRTVVVRHHNGLETLYAHLSRYGVKENDTVVAGSYLGKGGASGNARGSHLHLEMTYNGIHIHPENLLYFDEDNLVKSKDLWITKTSTRPELHNSRRQSKLEIFSTEEEALASMNRAPIVYIVKKGDTLSRISSKNNVSIYSLCKTNHIRQNSTLRIGQKLVIEKVL
ncbi:M23 family metallopeptidase [Xanthomarina sp. F2636L]|uniref:M23 family metallopeptidase n=1 Tax=Xanthomarina sp. F2636L TaxID=2996018 RepID=UPI00225DE1AE|nr:M23 family metallopeptidase [Xanthomarina sp. F2636L]MCX7549581.1 M23 family metallopeptidase [Xanthomarina sp. F2636L]